MFYIYKTSVYLHILCAMFWIGGMIFTAAVLVPAFRNKILAPKKGVFFTAMGRIFSRISWILFSLLLITGYIQLWYRGYTFSYLMTGEFWHTPFGHTLGYKLTAFAGVLIISGIHDFYLGPKAAYLLDKNPKSQQTKRYRKITSWAGRLNLLLGLIILYFAITLVRG